MAAQVQTAVRTAQRQKRELEDLQLVMRVRNGDDRARELLIRRYTGFVRMKASSYFLAGGESDDLVQEGLIGLCKAVRDFRPDKETSFRSFAELCVTRQIITAIKTATRIKHRALNSYVSFSHTPAGQDPDSDCTLGDALPGSLVDEPSVQVISCRGAAKPRLLARQRPVHARGGRAAPVSRGQLVRADGRGARLRHEDDRQRAPARETEDRHAPAVARRPVLASLASPS